MRSLVVTFFLSILLVSFVQAEDSSSATSPQELANRLDRLEQYLNNAALLDMLNALDSLKNEVSELRGEIEVQNHNLEQMQQKQRNLYTDVDGRLQRLESGTVTRTTSTIEPVVVTPVTETVNTTSAKIGDVAVADNNDSETVTETVAEVEPIDAAAAQADYQSAFKLLKESRYDQALTAFKEYLNHYPTSDYADNAQYWLGETNYVMQHYEQAINEYQALLTTYPDSQKVSHALLKIGYSYAELGNASDAEKTLKEVKAQYPGTTPARLADERLRKLLSNKESNT